MLGVSPKFMGCLKLILEWRHGIYYVIYSQFSLPWLCGDDFNELLKSHEKHGGRLWPYGQMEKFKEVLDECNLLDLGYVGNQFTWS